MNESFVIIKEDRPLCYNAFAVLRKQMVRGMKKLKDICLDRERSERSDLESGTSRIDTTQVIDAFETDPLGSG